MQNYDFWIRMTLGLEAWCAAWVTPGYKNLLRAIFQLNWSSSFGVVERHTLTNFYNNNSYYGIYGATRCPAADSPASPLISLSLRSVCLCTLDGHIHFAQVTFSNFPWGFWVLSCGKIFKLHQVKKHLLNYSVYTSKIKSIKYLFFYSVLLAVLR